MRMAVAMTGGDVLLQNTRPELPQIRRSTCWRRPAPRYTATNEGIRIARNGGELLAGRGDDAAVPRLPDRSCRRN